MVKLHEEHILEVDMEGKFALLSAESQWRWRRGSLFTHLEVFLDELSDIEGQFLPRDSVAFFLVVIYRNLCAVFNPGPEAQRNLLTVPVSFCI